MYGDVTHLINTFANQSSSLNYPYFSSIQDIDKKIFIKIITKMSIYNIKISNLARYFFFSCLIIHLSLRYKY